MPTLADLKYTAEIAPYLRQFEQPSLAGISQMQGGSTLGVATPRQQREAQTLRKAAQPVVNAVTDPFYAMTPGVDQRRQDARRRILEKVAAVTTDPMAATFAGVGAKMADKAALARSLEMKAAGVPDREIWRQTGWTHGFPDGKPRFEIDDSAAAYTENMPTFGRLKENRPLSDSFNHAELYGNYPDMAKLRLNEAEQGLGVYRDAEGSMGVSGLLPEKKYSGRKYFRQAQEAIGSTTLHESQHAIQSREGFAQGGSPASMQPDLSSVKSIEGSKEYQDALTQFRDIANTRGSEEAIKFQNASPIFQEWIQAQKNIVNPFEGYERLAGEVEARLVQRRREYSQQKRQSRYPLDDMDVKPRDQIVRFDGGRAQSIEQREPFVIARNPTKAEAQSILDKARYNDVRGIKDPRSGDVFIADANWTTHKDLADQMGVDWYDLIGADARNRFITKDPLDPRMYRTRD